jgi:hypothetical protein
VCTRPCSKTACRKACNAAATAASADACEGAGSVCMRECKRAATGACALMLSSHGACNASWANVTAPDIKTMHEIKHA